MVKTTQDTTSASTDGQDDAPNGKPLIKCGELPLSDLVGLPGACTVHPLSPQAMHMSTTARRSGAFGKQRSTRFT